MRFAAAVIVSLVVHLLVGLFLWLYLEHAPDVQATLDLSSVELSLAETVDDSAAVLPRPPAPQPPKPQTEPLREPPATELPEPLPEVPDAVEIPRPVERPVLPEPPPAPSVAAPAPRQARVDAPPQPRRTIRPDYPKGARSRGEQGDVLVELTVGADGSVERAEVVGSSGFRELDDAALRAVRTARFVPAKSGGKSVASTARITLTFKLK